MSVKLKGDGPIVLVDDDSDALAIARHGFRLSEVKNELILLDGGEGLVSYLQKLGPSEVLPSIVLIDINMPKPDGLDLVRWIRSDQRFSGLRVLMLTSSNDTGDMEAATMAGADGYQVKPFGIDDFIEFVNSLVP